MTRFFAAILSFLFFGAIVSTAGIIYIIWHYERDLPEYLQLADYQPPVTTRLYAGDGSMLAEYASEKRIFVPVSSIPKQLIEAFISAEDKTFYTHGGLDYKGLARAIITNIKNMGTGRRMVGASTITQQVAKNFLLSNEVTLTRKIKEAILAFKIEKTFSKDHIMELYLNEIYLGKSSYGVAAAALNYFNKSLSELTLSEKAFLAALPKAPNNYDPEKKKEAAIERRNWVLSRMEEDGYISKEEKEAAISEDIILAARDKNKVLDADYFAEEVRREIASKYGDSSLYQGGLDVRTSLNPVLQGYAVSALKNGLLNYDRRQGYRGSISNITIGEDWLEVLNKVSIPSYTPRNWRKALVMSLNEEGASISFGDGTSGDLPLKGMKWARVRNSDGSLGKEVEFPEEVLKVGDIVLVEQVRDKEGKYYALRQIPEVEGALIALDPHTGRVLALVGGFSFKKSQFNRAVQAYRAEATVVLLAVTVALVVAQDEDAVKGHGRDHNKECKEDDAHGDGTRGGHVGLGHGGDVVHVADLGDAAEERLAGERHVRKRAVLEVLHAEAGVDGVGADEVLIGVVLDNVILGGNGKNVAILTERDAAEHARK